MYRTTDFQTDNKYFKTGSKNYPLLNPESLNLDNPTNLNIRDTNLQIEVTRLLKQNEDLSHKLSKQKQKNFDLQEVKRRMQDDIRRLQFELDRISSYKNLNTREKQIKNNQAIQDNYKMKNQLDNYYEENKKLRNQNRKWMSQCQLLAKQKQQLINQNVILLKQISQYKYKVSEDNAKKNINFSKESENKSNNMYRLSDIVTMRSIKQKSHPNYSVQGSKQQINSLVFNSPDIYRHYEPTHNYIKSGQLNQKQQLSTNPSQQKISFFSPPAVGKGNINGFGVQKIYEQFYQDPEPSPRSFNNRRIQENLQYGSPQSHRQIIYTMNANNKYTSPRNMQPNLKSPSVISYGDRYSPMLYNKKISEQPQKQDNKNEQQNTDRYFLQTYQKKQLKDEVSSLRNDLVDQLIDKYYKNSLEIAEKQKSNSLKIFIQQISPKLNTMQQMVLNYLEARSMLAQSCPTLRLKWQPSPLTVRSDSPSTHEQLIYRNSVNISKIYETIKQNTKKQKTLAGQYLGLFRFLTLLSKIEQELDPLLIQCIKHSALKQIHRIKLHQDGKSTQAEHE